MAKITLEIPEELAEIGDRLPSPKLRRGFGGEG
jgi:hypothetical protein